MKSCALDWFSHINYFEVSIRSFSFLLYSRYIGSYNILDTELMDITQLHDIHCVLRFYTLKMLQLTPSILHLLFYYETCFLLFTSTWSGIEWVQLIFQFWKAHFPEQCFHWRLLSKLKIISYRLYLENKRYMLLTLRGSRCDWAHNEDCFLRMEAKCI